MEKFIFSFLFQCPMCASQSIYRGVHRVVWGTSISDINKSGREQLRINM